MKQLLLPTKIIRCASAALFVAISITGCTTPDMSYSERSSQAGRLLDNRPKEGEQSAIPVSQSAQTAAPLTTKASANGEPELYQIDLPTALRLASVQNYKIAIAREKIAEASAQLDESKVLLLPALTVGASYNRHDGQIQETNGNVLDINRSARYAGLGAGAVGAGTIQYPGVSLTIDLADAFFEPLAARQNLLAAKAGAAAVTNQVLLDVCISYYELVQAKAALAIAEEAYQNASYLAELTQTFARTGEGLDSDAERAAVEQLLRKRNLQKAREAFGIQSIRLVEMLHLDSKVQLDPVDTNVRPIHIVPADRPLNDLIDTAMLNHPALKQQQALVDHAFERFRQTKNGPLIPNIALGFSEGNFDGKSGGSGGRSDFDAMVYWRLYFGDEASARRQHSRYQQARLERLAAVDHIASEVAQAYTHIESLERQVIPSASAVERASRSLQLNRERIYEKQGLPIEVLQAIQSLETTRRLYLDTVIDYNQAQFSLYTALGQPPSEALAGIKKSKDNTAK